MMSDDFEHLDEHGDVPAIELSVEPISEIPTEDLLLLGQLMAWAAYIEVDLFTLYILAKPGDEIRRRKEFYKEAVGLYQRIALVRRSFKGKLKGDLPKVLDALLRETEVLAQLRNEWAHNPIIRFGPKRAVLRWIVGSRDYAGKLKYVDSRKTGPLFPHIAALHQKLQKLAALINNPKGGSFAISFGDKSEKTNAQIARLLKRL